MNNDNGGRFYVAPLAFFNKVHYVLAAVQSADGELTRVGQGIFLEIAGGHFAFGHGGEVGVENPQSSRQDVDQL